MRFLDLLADTWPALFILIIFFALITFSLFLIEKKQDRKLECTTECFKYRLELSLAECKIACEFN